MRFHIESVTALISLSEIRLHTGVEYLTTFVRLLATHHTKKSLQITRDLSEVLEFQRCAKMQLYTTFESSKRR